MSTPNRTRQKLGTWKRKHAAPGNDLHDLYDRNLQGYVRSQGMCRGVVEVFVDTATTAIYRCTRCSSADANGRIDRAAILENPDFTPVPNGS